jgi:hypothetical protein
VVVVENRLLACFNLQALKSRPIDLRFLLLAGFDPLLRLLALAVARIAARIRWTTGLLGELLISFSAASAGTGLSRSIEAFKAKIR